MTPTTPTNLFADFTQVQSWLKQHFFNDSVLVHTERWQGMPIGNKPEMATYELMNVQFSVPLPTSSLSWYQRNIQPNLPWADDHFLERVSGDPLNPGKEWRNWPWALSADKFRKSGGEDPKFNHTYMERYWPTWAGGDKNDGNPNYGIRNRLGDLNDLVDLLAQQPLTRQAWLPIFFPEDTGVADGGRKPCTLGYHFIMRDNRLHIYYPLRSCDFVRHFRDDIYLTVRLLLWVLEQLQKKDKAWKMVFPGVYSMHMTSLHLFKNDWVGLFGAPRA